MPSLEPWNPSPFLWMYFAGRHWLATMKRREKNVEDLKEEIEMVHYK